MKQRYPSLILEDAVNEFSKLPGVGKKTALRLVLHLLRQPETDVSHFGEVLQRLASDITYCSVCHNVSDMPVCELCSDMERDHATICVVENVKEVMVVENTRQFQGLYHVLGGIISPMDGIGPNDLQIESLVTRVQEENIKEVILALSTTMEGDTTNFYIYRKLSPLGVKVSILARGVSIGDEIEYADEITLGRSIANRTLFTETF